MEATVASLTNKLIEQLKPDPTRDIVHWDANVPGFGLRIWPSGKMIFILKFRDQLHVQRKITIGDARIVKLPTARARAQLALANAKIGIDPEAALAEARGAPTVEDVASRYMREHALVRKKRRSAEGDETLLRLHILPRLGKRRITRVVRQDINTLHFDMRSTPGAANRAVALLSKMFNLCEQWGLRPDGTNPCRHVPKYKEKKVERYLTASELHRLGMVLTQAEEQRQELPSVVPAIRLLMLTGCRLSEILTLQWKEVDWERKCLRLSDSKTGSKTVYLAPPAVDVLRSIAQLANNPYVIVGEKPGSLGEPPQALVSLAQKGRAFGCEATRS